jgi:hypothetical protein
MASQADVDAARSELDRIRNEQKRIETDRKGASVGTLFHLDWKIDGNWKDLLIGDHILKVEGGYQKIQIGVSNQFVFGFKGEFIAPVSFTLSVPVEVKAVMGLTETKIYGVKRETIGGANYDILHGIKFEKRSQTTTNTGGAVLKRDEGKIARKVRNFTGKIGSLGEKVVTKVEKHSRLQVKMTAMDEKLSKLEEDCKTLKEKYSKLTMKVSKYTEKADSWKVEAKRVDIQGKPFLGKGGGEGGKLVMNAPQLESGRNYAVAGAAWCAFKGSKHIMK